MSSPDGVLDAIDAALRDFTVSEDAMRWSPDAEDRTSGGGLLDNEAALERVRAALISGWPILEAVFSERVAPYADGELYWNMLESREMVWPEGACPSCGRCTVENIRQAIHNGEPWGPAKVGYMCGYETRQWRWASPEGTTP